LPASGTLTISARPPATTLVVTGSRIGPPAAVAGEARELPLDAELAAARDVLASAGIDVHAHIGANPPPEAASVLVPVLREAVTNILKHSSASYCTLELTTGPAGQLRLWVSNDGSNEASSAPLAEAGRTGSGLGNLAARLEAAGGQLAARREGDTFSLALELPLPTSTPPVVGQPVVAQRLV
jgi:two-component system sensor histidine kinase DesK